MLDHLIMHLLQRGVAATSDKKAILDRNGIVCRASLLPRLLMPAGILICLAGYNIISKDPKSGNMEYFPLGLAILLALATLHFWTLRIKATVTSIEYGSLISSYKTIDLTQSFTFNFEPHQSTLCIKQKSNKLTINHFYDGHKDLLEWMVLVLRDHEIEI